MPNLDNFADAPVSVSEIRSDKSTSARDWTPRDVLVSMLRALDRGEIKPEAVVIVYREPGSDQHSTRTCFYASSPDVHVTLGLIELGKLKLLGKL